ncbi:putative receptor-like protein kinase At4g00960 isoform X1 [Cajanus cajan]|uniref:Cysteine-rich receptor-like protein kinase 25 n=2 Tax=Cajanus cajan TaxID=3821 RepID=A0A151QYV2_CAJCA|nr:putative receptor-like protein kinase At4g00960 isoform X1 [Cajanus cajan]KYP35494.1 Cysteine-rich receptor-like protein kinase 25 [Cajanus cajan]
MEGKLLNLRSSYSFIFLLFLSFKSLNTKAQSPNYVGDDCEYSTSKPLSTAYQTNLKSVLSWLSTDAATSKGYNHNSFGNNTPGDAAVYGLYDCRGDVAGYFCQFCVSTASREVLQRCPNRVSAIIWYDFCILRYSNENFFGNVTVDPSWHAVGTKNVSSAQEIQKGEDFMRSLIRKATVETNQLYYMDGFNLSSTQRRYGLVQCSRDLTNDGCRQCLETMLAQVPKCCEHNLGWQVLAASCLIKYDDYIFYLFHTQPSSVSVPDTQIAKKRGAGKTRILIIGLSVLGAVALLCFSVYCLWFRNRNRRQRGRGGRIPDTIRPSSYHNVQTEETLNPDLPTIPLITILKSTDHFSDESKLGEGGFGPVYKGTLPDGRQIAVKRLSQTSGQGSEEFKNEVMFIAKLQHRNLVRLLACCLENNEKILVYEYLSNASLDFHLFDDRKKRQLDWNIRLSIINGIAKGLLYLHEDSRLKVIHRDLKASNVLLDDEMNPKISDFGLARSFEKGQNQANTNRVMGTYGYMAPEYAMEGLFSVKSDTFSFGVLVLEIICGKKNSGFYLSECGQSLTLYAWKIWCAGKCLELMDPVLEESYIESEVVKCIHIGLLCVQEDAADRPTMSTVVVMLASDTMALPKPNQPAFSVGRMTYEDASTSKSSKSLSINDVTVSNILPR